VKGDAELRGLLHAARPGERVACDVVGLAFVQRVGIAFAFLGIIREDLVVLCPSGACCLAEGLRVDFADRWNMACVAGHIVGLVFGHTVHESVFEGFMWDLHVVLRIGWDALLGAEIHQVSGVGSAGDLTEATAGNVLVPLDVPSVAGDVVPTLLLSCLTFHAIRDLSTAHERCERAVGFEVVRWAVARLSFPQAVLSVLLRSFDRSSKTVHSHIPITNGGGPAEHSI